MRRALRAIAVQLDNIKFAHTIFALPFCLLAFGVGARPGPSARLLLLVLGAMVSARTAAMSYNRWTDADIDAENPRTKGRPVPSGRLSRGACLAWTVAAGAAFLACAAAINLWTLLLSPIALGIVLGYSWSKRFTWASHLWLGAALAIAPMGGWIAAGGAPLAPFPMLLALGVLCWVAGFDVIYATQDHSFDRERGLHSAVVRFGVRGALVLARGLHALSLGSLVAAGLACEAFGLLYWIGLGVAAACIVWEHLLVRADDLSRVNVAFFTMNGLVSLVLCAAGLVDAYVV